MIKSTWVNANFIEINEASFNILRITIFYEIQDCASAAHSILTILVIFVWIFSCFLNWKDMEDIKRNTTLVIYTVSKNEFQRWYQPVENYKIIMSNTLTLNITFLTKLYLVCHTGLSLLTVMASIKWSSI